MVQVYASIGSNIEAEKNVRACCNALTAAFGQLSYSTVYETEAVGFVGDPFINLVVGFTTSQDIDFVFNKFREIESSLGRDRSEPRFSSRSIDIDLLLYNQQVIKTDRYSIPRPEITEQAFVLKPLADLCGDLRHPTENRTISELWQSFEKKSLPMQPIKGFFEQE